ncbi:PREDICTED: protein spinster isoform X2 [Ceratosolen solmsi marchali]|uniref:Protein spinster isoform X2 n=1 Tax=Ceratosolen solmsi marchali TaxID=326594 RepID=A0AAJ7E3G7_9HYME|nr:PREDICTED: protein spinster isoform X2 [Ceratosolen solmsi marchali]
MVNDGHGPATSAVVVGSRSVRKSSNSNGASLRSVTVREWVAVFVLCFVNLINYMDRFTIAGVLTEIQNDFHIDNGQSGLLQTAFIISYMIFAPLFGYLGDRYNRKIIMSAGVFLWCLTTFIGSYMKSYGWFLFFRTLVGIGEASYSTIAPTIISDLFIKDVRSKMLALFYFAIPVGSGLGYITGGEMATATGSWQWGLRITPSLGILAIILILSLVRDPVRGEKEGGSHVATTAWSDDIKALLKNQSFMLSTVGFTCVSFVSGALAFWGPKFIQYGFILQNTGQAISIAEVAYKFGVIAMIAGLIGVPLGSMIAQKLRVRWHQADPLICAVGLLISAPLIFFGSIFASSNATACYILIFFGQLAINLNWSIVADMLLYVVIPTRRSTAEAFQILFAHAFGDAGSPYLIGVISDALKFVLLPNLTIGWIEPEQMALPLTDDLIVDFRSLQYALFLTIFVEVLGSLFFFLTALYIEKDKALVDLTISDMFLDIKKKGQAESTRL